MGKHDGGITTFYVPLAKHLATGSKDTRFLGENVTKFNLKKRFKILDLIVTDIPQEFNVAYQVSERFL